MDEIIKKCREFPGIFPLDHQFGDRDYERILLAFGIGLLMRQDG